MIVAHYCPQCYVDRDEKVELRKRATVKAPPPIVADMAEEMVDILPKQGKSIYECPKCGMESSIS